MDPGLLYDLRHDMQSALATATGLSDQLLEQINRYERAQDERNDHKFEKIDGLMPIEEYDKREKYRKHVERMRNSYAKAICIVNASGTGKTTLTMHLATTTPALHIFIRKEADLGIFMREEYGAYSGFPFGDCYVFDYFNSVPELGRDQYPTVMDGKSEAERDLVFRPAVAHAKVLCFLRKLFENLGEHVAAASFAPMDTLKSLALAALGDETDRKRRAVFFKQVVLGADEYFKELMNNSDYVAQFGPYRSGEWGRLEMLEWEKPRINAAYSEKRLTAFADSCLSAAESFMALLRERSTDDVRFVLCWDEVGSFLEMQNEYSYAAFLRVLRLLRELPIWNTFTSTNPAIADLGPQPEKSPNTRVDPSCRAIPTDEPELHLPDCYTTFKPDIMDKGIEHDLAVGTYGYLKHACKFGRPFWWSCHESNWIESWARQKLFAVRSDQRLFDYDSDAQSQSLAMLSTLLGVEPRSHYSPARRLILSLVKNHIRPIVSLDIDEEMLKTTQWSEPVVAHAALSAARILRYRSLFAMALDHLYTMRRSNIDIRKGHTEKLIGRILLMRARVAIKGSWFSLEEFLEELLGQSAVLPLLEALEPDVKHAQMNWTHFVTAPTDFDGAYKQDVWQHLLRRCAAVQGTHPMSCYDCILIGYKGDLSIAYTEGNVVLLGLSFGGKDSRSDKDWHMYDVLGETRDAFISIPREASLTKDNESQPTAPSPFREEPDENLYVHDILGEAREAFISIPQKATLTKDNEPHTAEPSPYREDSAFIGRTTGNSMISLCLNFGSSPRQAEFYMQERAPHASHFKEAMYCGDIYGLDKETYPAAWDCVETLRAMIEDDEAEARDRDPQTTCPAFLSTMREQGKGD